MAKKPARQHTRRSSPPSTLNNCPFDQLPELLTVEEWRKQARVSRTAAYELIRAQGLKVLRFGRAIRIPRETLQAK